MMNFNLPHDKKGADVRNTIIAFALSAAVLIGWTVFYDAPRREEAARKQELAQTESELNATPDGASSRDTARIDETTPFEPAPRISLNNGLLLGSLSVAAGGRMDDITLTNYRAHIDKNSTPIALFTQGENPYYAEFGWIGENPTDTPPREQHWKPVSTGALTPNSPVVLELDHNGIRFRRRFVIDDGYLIRVEDSALNMQDQPIRLAQYGLIARHGTPETLNFYILHEGLIGALSEPDSDKPTLREIDYDDVVDARRIEFRGARSWLGITDKYWLAALLQPDNQGQIDSQRFAATGSEAAPRYQADITSDWIDLAPQEKATRTRYLYVGAKEVDKLDRYREAMDIPLFDRAVDFGWFYFITKPLFLLLMAIQNYIGNFGLSILALTVLVKLTFLPLAYKSYASMGKMRLVQPEMTELRDKYKDDKAKLQQEMLALYKKRKINPLSGCLPVLLQIPVFFALYKVLFVTIEMRHTPFFGWIQDLSAPDPTGMLNVFGLLPFDVPAILNIVNLGAWPIIMGGHHVATNEARSSTQ